MTRRKKSYAAKHKLPVEEPDLILNELQQNEDIWNILRQPYEFEHLFLDLPYKRKLVMVETLKKIISEKFSIRPAKIKKALINIANADLERVHWLTGADYEEGNAYFTISDDEKKLVRMEFYGTINVRREHELSAFYKYFTKPQNKLKKARLKDYDLLQSPMWRVFNQFDSFRKIAPKVRRYLYQQKINPDALKVMTVSDFCDVIYNVFGAEDDSLQARFFEGVKYKFVKEFMRYGGKALEERLLKKGIDPRSAASLCRQMRLYGRCDINTLVVTETNFTQRVLDDLRKNGYDVSNFKVGEPIAEEFIIQVLDNKQGNLLLARDENGKALDKSDLPRYEVHHKNAVKFADTDDYLVKVNYFNNLMLVESSMHQIYYHGFDSIIEVSNNNECYYSRLNTPFPSMCLIDDFNSATDAMYYEMQNNPAFAKHIKRDKENVVNYYYMQYERLENIADIAQTYKIEYSKSDIALERNSLMKLLRVDIQVPESDLAALAEWLPENRKKKLMNKKGKGPIPPLPPIDGNSRG